MEYEDRITIQTPEGLELGLSLAGVGSRFTAAIVDFLIQNAIVVAAAFALLGAEFLTDDELLGGAGGAAFALVLFLVFLGYDILFEVFASGRTPGKRATGIRVVRTGGQPVGFLTSAIRNVLRVIDFMPFMYAVGIVAILATRRNQRLGDLAAGTLVVRERQAASWRFARTRRGSFTAGADAAAAWDVSGITAEEAGAVRSFLERRDDLEPPARAELARALADALRPKVAGVPGGLDDEVFLERVSGAKVARG